MFFTVVRSGVMAAGLAMACGTHSGLSHAQESAGVTSKSAASQSAVGQAIAAIKAAPGGLHDDATAIIHTGPCGEPLSAIEC
jgi:hypothetical protein